MRLSACLATSLLSLVLSFGAKADPHAQHNRHREIANRARGDVHLYKRYDNTRFTYYSVGLGACGKWNNPPDFIVALNSAQYGGGYPGPHCFQGITITYGGKTANAVIMDECPGCPWGGLDMSEGLFQYFAPLSQGVMYGSWWFDGDGGPPPPPSPTTTKHTSTYVPPPPTSTWKPSSTSTSTSTSTKTTSSSSTSKSKSSSAASSTTSSTISDPLAEPTTSAISGQHTIDVIYEVVLGLGDVVAAGAHVNN